MYGKSHTEESLKKMRETKIGMFNGEDNPNSKKYIAISPNSKNYYLSGNVKDFCNEYGLSYSTIRNTLKSNKPVKSGKTKGWVLKYDD